jgi:hypothetical protein
MWGNLNTELLSKTLGRANSAPRLDQTQLGEKHIGGKDSLVHS